MSKAYFVSAFEKPWPKYSVNTQGRINNLPADSIKPFSAFLSALGAIYLSGLCVDHLVRPPSICSFSLAAA